jgi:diadenosine tetraphosphate (Ap4A) HIT family hydrolase
MSTLEQLIASAAVPWKTSEVIAKSPVAWLIADAFPVTPGHVLIVPVDPSPHLITQCLEIAWRMGDEGVQQGSWEGFNVGMNLGAAAGQTIMYPHVHMMPRRTGDAEDPTGGVRNVIPGKGNYKNEAC